MECTDCEMRKLHSMFLLQVLNFFLTFHIIMVCVSIYLNGLLQIFFKVEVEKDYETDEGEGEDREEGERRMAWNNFIRTCVCGQTKAKAKLQ